MIIQAPTKSYTKEEYLQLEENSDLRHEYIDGEMIEMTGGTTNHNQIAGNFYRNFPLTINNQDYYTYMENVRLWIPQSNVYTYPDLIIIKDKPIYEGKKKLTITNPQIIVEVLSESTQSYDRTEKFRFYRSISSLQEYVLIDQYSYAIEQYFKQSDSQWLINFYTEENSIFKLLSVNWEILLKDLYQRVDFNLSEPE